MTDFARVLARTDETTWVECPECGRAVEVEEGPRVRVVVECRCGYEGEPKTTDLPF